MKNALRLSCSLILLICSAAAEACQCPPSSLSLEETKKYEIIFKGVVDSVKACGAVPGEAYFTVQELFKGNTTRGFPVIFDCAEPCATGFKKGEEWIIYTRYKQINNARMDWCSRSRKFFRHEQEDFYKVNFGNDFFDELDFLRKNLGQHRLLSEQKNAAGNRNLLPNTNQLAIALLFSIVGIVLFYFLFKKFFR